LLILSNWSQSFISMKNISESLAGRVGKSFVNNGIDLKRYLYYYRDRYGLECDTILRLNNG